MTLWMERAVLAPHSPRGGPQPGLRTLGVGRSCSLELGAHKGHPSLGAGVPQGLHGGDKGWQRTGKLSCPILQPRRGKGGDALRALPTCSFYKGQKPRRLLQRYRVGDGAQSVTIMESSERSE